MKVHHVEVGNFSEVFEKPNTAVVTSGTFDGVHIGHQKILERVKEIAQEKKGESVVVTFWPHPRFVLHPADNSLKLLSTFNEKISLLEQMGIDHLVKISFTKQFSQLSSDAFIRQILVNRIHTKYLVIGYDHRFGHNREGSFDYLVEHASEYGFSVEEIPRQDVDHVVVSSTKIRNALEQGDAHTASEYLGRFYSVTGEVTHGNQLGRNIGFPTANLHIPEFYKLIPADGAYAVLVEIDKKIYKGMMNIGYRPTVSGKGRTLEVNIFDLNKDLYGAFVTVFFVALIRKEKKFAGVEQLQQQLEKDRQAAIQILSEN